MHSYLGLSSLCAPWSSLAYTYNIINSLCKSRPGEAARLLWK